MVNQQAGPRFKHAVCIFRVPHAIHLTNMSPKVIALCVAKKGYVWQTRNTLVNGFFSLSLFQCSNGYYLKTEILFSRRQAFTSY